MKKIKVFLDKISVKNRRIISLIVSILILITTVVVIVMPKNDKVELGEIKGDDGEIIESTDGDNAEEIASTDSLGNNYFTRTLPLWGINVDIPENWVSKIDKEKGLINFLSKDKNLEGIEISLKYSGTASSVPSLLRKNFDSYFLYDFIYHGKNGIEYQTTNYEPQDLNLIKDDSISVWVDRNGESDTYKNERGDISSYYKEYLTKPTDVEVREDKKLIAVQENPYLVMKEPLTHNVFNDFYCSAYYFGDASKEDSVVLTVAGPQSKSLEINEISKNIAYSINFDVNISSYEKTEPLDSTTVFCGETLQIPQIKTNSFSDDYTSPSLNTNFVNITWDNESKYSFEEFYKSPELAKIIEQSVYKKSLVFDEQTKSASISGAPYEKITFAGHNALKVSLLTETRSTKTSVLEKIKSRGYQNYSNILLVDLGENKIAIFAVTSPSNSATANSKTFESILK